MESDAWTEADLQSVVMSNMKDINIDSCSIFTMSRCQLSTTESRLPTWTFGQRRAMHAIVSRLPASYN